VGDVLQNLISTLDHLAYQLVCVGSGSEGPFTYVYFPIAGSALEYESQKLKKVKRMKPDAIKQIDAIKPYRGGNDLLWHLYELNNIDKHRLIIMVGSAFSSVNLGAHLKRSMEKIWTGPPLPSVDLYVKPADNLFPLKVGDPLFADSPDADINEAMDFHFEVAFGEPGIIEGKPLLTTIHEFTKLVDGIVRRLEPFLT
jgi:hypothetical protein